jgi:hypothetical protein
MYHAAGLASTTTVAPPPEAGHESAIGAPAIPHG